MLLILGLAALAVIVTSLCPGTRPETIFNSVLTLLLVSMYANLLFVKLNSNALETLDDANIVIFPIPISPTFLIIRGIFIVSFAFMVIPDGIIISIDTITGSLILRGTPPPPPPPPPPLLTVTVSVTDTIDVTLTIWVVIAVSVIRKTDRLLLEADIVFKEVFRVIGNSCHVQLFLDVHLYIARLLSLSRDDSILL